MCRACVKAQNKVSRKKIDLLNHAIFNFFDAENGPRTDESSKKIQIF